MFLAYQREAVCIGLSVSSTPSWVSATLAACAYSDMLVQSVGATCRLQLMNSASVVC